MRAPVDTKNPSSVEAVVQAAYLEMFPKGDPLFAPHIFSWASDCFQGRIPGYQAIDTPYHDFEHTLQVTLCMTELLQQRQDAEAKPQLTQRFFELGLIATLFHDTGYLKALGDNIGTGAKYTSTHVKRGMDFATKFLAGKMFLPHEFVSVQNMIQCTGMDATPTLIPFGSQMELVVGQALATADLLGQMAAGNYLDKLPLLYSELAEAALYNKEKATYVSMYSSAMDLVAKTPSFWDNYVKLKLERELGGVHKFLRNPYPDGLNPYIDCIEANIEKIRQLLATNSFKYPCSTDTARITKP